MHGALRGNTGVGGAQSLVESEGNDLCAAGTAAGADPDNPEPCRRFAVPTRPPDNWP